LLSTTPNTAAGTSSCTRHPRTNEQRKVTGDDIGTTPRVADTPERRTGFRSRRDGAAFLGMR
jgi:hypothetical protein